MANSLTANIKRSISLPGLTLTSNESVGYDSYQYLKQSIAANQTDLALTLPVPYTSRLKFVYILATQDMTIEFQNNAGVSGSVSVKANTPKIVTYSGNGGSAATCLDRQVAAAAEVVTADALSGIFVTNTTAGVLEIVVGYNNN